MRPKIICHMMSSVDGRLHPERYSNPYNGRDKNELIELYFYVSDKLKGDAMLMGRKTLQKYFLPDTFTGSGHTPIKSKSSFLGKRDSDSTVIVVDPLGKTSYENIEASNYNFITILAERVSEEYLDHLKKNGISYVFAGNDGEDLSAAMDVIGSEFGIKTILLEGGGMINGFFLKAALIDELSLMIYPGIDGLSGVAAIFEYAGKENELPASQQALEFTSMELLEDGIVWLRYRFHQV